MSNNVYSYPIPDSQSTGGTLPGRRAAEAERREQILAAAVEVATKDGLEGLTVRRVALAAGMSHGLVHFHFQSKADLMSALLDRVLATSLPIGVIESTPSTDPPLARLMVVMCGEIARLTADPGLARLFFDFWVMGARQRMLRARILTALARYRGTFRPLVEDVLRAEPERFSGVTATKLSAVVLAFIKGSALQSMIDPRGFDVSVFLEAATALLTGMETSDRPDFRTLGSRGA